MIGQEGVKKIFWAERKEGIGGINGEDDKETTEDETKLFEEEIGMGSESENETKWVGVTPLIGWLFLGTRRSVKLAWRLGERLGGKCSGRDRRRKREHQAVRAA